MNSNKYGNSPLITMHNIAQPMNHLLTIQLVNQPSAPSTKTNFKAQYFYFLTLAPGAGRGADRTYDFSLKINMKFSIAEVFSLAFILQQLAGGNPRVLPYSKFSKSGTGTKIVSIVENSKQSKSGNERVITMFISCNSQKYSINLSPAESYALSKQLDMSAVEATKLEFARLSSTPTIHRPQQQIQSQEPMPPMQQHNRSPQSEEYMQYPQVQNQSLMPQHMQHQMQPQSQPQVQPQPQVQLQPQVQSQSQSQSQPQLQPQPQPQVQVQSQPDKHIQNQTPPQINTPQLKTPSVNNVVDQFSSVLNAQL